MRSILFVALLASTSAWADSPANLNKCWGDIASQVARAGIMGQHSSSSGLFTPDPGEGGRRGVGNVSKEDFGDGTGQAQHQGAQGEHAITNGGRLGSPNLPPDIPEAQVGPFECGFDPLTD